MPHRIHRVFGTKPTLIGGRVSPKLSEHKNAARKPVHPQQCPIGGHEDQWRAIQASITRGLCFHTEKHHFPEL
jgi:hypothetical protein